MSLIWTDEAKTLLQGKPYVPSWLMPIPKLRMIVPKLGGHYGLKVPVIPEGTKSLADPHAELEQPV